MKGDEAGLCFIGSLMLLCHMPRDNAFRSSYSAEAQIRCSAMVAFSQARFLNWRIQFCCTWNNVPFRHSLLDTDMHLSLIMTSKKFVLFRQPGHVLHIRHVVHWQIKNIPSDYALKVARSLWSFPAALNLEMHFVVCMWVVTFYDPNILSTSKPAPICK